MAHICVLSQLHLCQALRDPDNSFELPNCDRNCRPLRFHRLADGDIVILQNLHCFWRDSRSALCSAVRDVLSELRDGQRSLLLLLHSAAVQRQQMLRQVVVTNLVPDVPNQEHHVKPRQDRGLEVHLVGRVGEVVVGAEARVGGGEHTASGVEHRRDACLGDGDGLLLHGLMDGNAILHVHLVKLVNANNTAIGQNHGATFQGEPVAVTDDGSCETCSAAAFATGVHSNWSCLVGKLQELTLGSAWVSEEKHVDVASHASSVREALARASEEQAGDGPLHIVHDVLGACANGGGDGPVNHVPDVRVLRQRVEALLLLGADVQGSLVPRRRLKPKRLDVGVLDGTGAALPATGHLVAHRVLRGAKDADGCQPGAR
mmetsp:Transcript_19469/g.34720  ORF Transcript_19469/g.34720 Transcript_19469/m.34720 type:complete len:374 (+) Transcript_19469:648-1769(+)